MLTGFPLKQYKINKLDKDGNVEKHVWANADTVAYYLNSSCAEYELTEESRMVYATPQWLPKEENPNGCILFLDDFSRCNNTLIQACYELINEGTVNLLVTRANRTWKDIDQKALNQLNSVLQKKDTLFFYLTEAGRNAVEEYVGQLPPYTPFKNFVYRMSQMGLTATENNNRK